MTTNTIIWNNYKIYDPNFLLKITCFIEKNMNGLLPLYGKEKRELTKYSEQNNIPLNEIFCLRNIIKIQKEIDNSKKYHSRIKIIKRAFNKLIKNLSKNSDESNLQIRYFLKSTQMPIHFVLNTINKMPEFKKLTLKNLDHIKKIQNIVRMDEMKTKYCSELFEHSLEGYLKQKYKLSFRTESDIKKDKDYNITPDILFDKPIILKLDKKDYQIRWIDAKNYILVNIPFIINSLRKQAAKYNDIFGPGAFVFHYGYDHSIIIPNVVILDGSFISI